MVSERDVVREELLLDTLVMVTEYEMSIILSLLSDEELLDLVACLEALGSA